MDKKSNEENEIFLFSIDNSKIRKYKKTTLSFRVMIKINGYNKLYNRVLNELSAIEEIEGEILESWGALSKISHRYDSEKIRAKGNKLLYDFAKIHKFKSFIFEVDRAFFDERFQLLRTNFQNYINKIEFTNIDRELEEFFFWMKNKMSKTTELLDRLKDIKNRHSIIMNQHLQI